MSAEIEGSFSGNLWVEAKVGEFVVATATGGKIERPYRFGCGILDASLNGVADPGEKKVCFEFCDYSTSFIFCENHQ